jgi:hypothetical protein
MLFNFKASLQKWSHLVTFGKKLLKSPLRLFNQKEDLDKRTFGFKLLMIELLRSIEDKF